MPELLLAEGAVVVVVVVVVAVVVWPAIDTPGDSTFDVGTLGFSDDGIL